MSQEVAFGELGFEVRMFIGQKLENDPGNAEPGTRLFVENHLAGGVGRSLSVGQESGAT